MNDNPLRKIRKVSFAILVVALWITNTSVLAQPSAGGEDSTALAKKTQNPVSDLISVPFQNNFNFDVGPNDDLQYILNVQPVYPMRLSETWNLIHRPIIPLIDQPPLAPGLDSEFGIGDIQYQAFLSPAKPGEITWGIGPVKHLKLHAKMLLADGLRAIVGSINLAPGSFDDRRELAIEVNDDDIVEGLHKVAKQDWENSHALDLTDEGLFADLEEKGDGGAEKLVLRMDHEHSKKHPHKHAGKHKE
ncbi:MAG: phospholipase D-like domain-containing protein [Gammaproteobacteria bacterium]